MSAVDWPGIACPGQTFERFVDYESCRCLARRDTAAGTVLAAASGGRHADPQALEVALDEAEELGRYAPTDVVELISNEDWLEAMGFASDFFWPDIARVIATSEGENDMEPWVALFGLSDGRFGRLSAGCDYTGWS